jgi:hypothetical protein
MDLGEMGLGEMVLGEMVLGDMGIHRPCSIHSVMSCHFARPDRGIEIQDTGDL